MPAKRSVILSSEDEDADMQCSSLSELNIGQRWYCSCHYGSLVPCVGVANSDVSGVIDACVMCKWCAVQRDLWMVCMLYCRK